MNVLLIDNFDSFAFNLVDELRKQGASVHIWRNDLPALSALDRILQLPAPRMIVLSPGPGKPEEAGCCEELVKISLGKVPLFGVCLGLQAIVQALGGQVGSAGEVVHGKTALIEHNKKGIFTGLPSPMRVGRYHSLAALVLPEDLEQTACCARSKGGVLAEVQNDQLTSCSDPASCAFLTMAIAHRTHPTAGVQFHPESILSPQGGLLLEQTIHWAASFTPRPEEEIHARTTQ